MTLFVIKDTDEYLSDIMRKVLNSYSIIENLSDQPNDLQVLEIELKKNQWISFGTDKKSEFTK